SRMPSYRTVPCRPPARTRSHGRAGAALMRVKVGVAETTGFGFFPDAVTVGGGAAAATLPARDGCRASGGLDVPPSRHAASPATAAPTTRMETSATSTVRWR